MARNAGAEDMGAHEEDACGPGVLGRSHSLSNYRQSRVSEGRWSVEGQKDGQIEIVPPLGQRLNAKARTVEGGVRHARISATDHSGGGICAQNGVRAISSPLAT